MPFTLSYQVVKESNLKPFASLFADYQAELGFEYETQEVIHFLKKRLITGDALMRLVIDKNNDKPLAMAFVQPVLSTLSMRVCWTINDIFTAPAYRRKGVAEFLLHSIEKEACNQSVFSLRIATQQTNNAAQQLYKKLDFGIVQNTVNFSKVIDYSRCLF